MDNVPQIDRVHAQRAAFPRNSPRFGFRPWIVRWRARRDRMALTCPAWTFMISRDENDIAEQRKQLVERVQPRGHSSKRGSGQLQGLYFQTPQLRSTDASRGRLWCVTLSRRDSHRHGAALPENISNRLLCRCRIAYQARRARPRCRRSTAQYGFWTPRCTYDARR